MKRTIKTFWALLFFSLHIYFFASVLNIHFRSSHIHGLSAITSKIIEHHPCNRLIFIVSDGLRGRTLIDINEKSIPFLRNLCQKGLCKISSAHLPTESRPGHVTLFSGVYEDLSSLFTGWKDNLVNYDTIFNHSIYTWGWGSPDIMKIIEKNNFDKLNIELNAYKIGFQDFTMKNPSELDRWVFSRVKSFLEASNQQNNYLNKSKIIFFLHLLGMDMTGHIHKPNSKIFNETLQTLDGGIKSLENTFDNFYKHDSRQTCYLLTSDHGMTDWGSHGAGSLDETIVPLFIWGLSPDIFQKNRDGQNWISNWNLTSNQEDIIDQADVVNIASCLLGIPFPSSSLGIIPKNFFSSKAKLLERECLISSILTLKNHFNKILENCKFLSTTGSKLRYIHSYQFDSRHNITQLHDIQQNLRSQIIQYQNYDTKLFKLSTGVAYMIFITIIISFVPNYHSQKITSFKNFSFFHTWYSFIITILSLVITLYLWSLSAPTLYYVYLLMPFGLALLLLFLLVTTESNIFLENSAFREIVKRNMIRIIYLFLMFIIIIGSFYDRRVMVFGLIAKFIYTYITTQHYCKLFNTLKLQSFNIFMLTPFYFIKLPGQYTIIPFFTCIAWLIWLIHGVNFQKYKLEKDKKQIIDKRLVVKAFVFIFNILCLIICRLMPSINFFNFYLSHIFSWTFLTILIFLFIFSKFHNNLQSSSSKYNVHHLHYYLYCINGEDILFTVFSLTTVSYEFLFLLLFTHVIKCWCSASHYTNTISDYDDDQNAATKYIVTSIIPTLEYIYFMFASFFGTGNVANLNSFDPNSCTCFLSTFNPVCMGAFIILKLIIPLIITTISYQLIMNNKTMKLSLFKQCKHVAIIYELFCFHYFLHVKNYGSWLHIGLSLSHYILCSIMMPVTFILLYVVNKFQDF